MRSHLGMASLALALAAAAPAGALLIDLASVTRDTESGLDWLDLPVTANLTFNEVLADEGGLISEGWRHANGRELCLLFADHAGASSACGGEEFFVAGDAPELMALLGLTLSTPVEQEIGGLYARRGGSAIAFLNSQPRSGGTRGAVMTDNLFGDDFAARQIAHFLVRASDPASSDETLRYTLPRPQHDPISLPTAPPADPSPLPPVSLEPAPVEEPSDLVPRDDGGRRRSIGVPGTIRLQPMLAFRVPDELLEHAEVTFVTGALTASGSPVPIPEPASGLLVGLGLSLLAARGALRLPRRHF